MKLESLTVGIYRVKIGDKAFNLSVVNSHGIIGVAGFEIGSGPPQKGKHLTLTDSVRNWIGEMELLCNQRDRLGDSVSSAVSSSV